MTDAADLRIAILGADGRMGRALIEAAPSHVGLKLTTLVTRRPPGDDARRVAALAGTEADWDVLVDFSRPAAALEALDLCISAGRPMVSGTTGFSDAERRQLHAGAERIALCHAGNFSTGIALCVALVRRAAAALGPDFDIEVVEAHHRHKVDAPSGTALMLGRAAAMGAKREHDDAIYARQGQTGPRPRGPVGYATVRGGDVVGEHSVLFLGDGERVEIAHKASSRLNFAHGALRAAAWIRDRPPGLYGMADVLDLGD